ncbi:MAG: lipid A-modifier LpxR family protein [Gemmobacter sp.]
MRKHLAVAALAAITLGTLAPAAPAQDRKTIGRGSILNNDLIGDGRDRWRTGGYTLSLTRAPGWDGQRPGRPFALTELRLHGQIVAPARLTAPSATDRRYAGLLSVGLHTHFNRGAVELSGGADLVAVGPSTQLGGFQSAIHGLFGLPSPDTARANQLPDALYPTVLVEAGLPMQAGFARIRPFVEAQAGVETFARIGADVAIGAFGQGDVTVRDTVTGHLYRATKTAPPTGFTFVFGGDVAHVASSALLPAAGAATLRATRTRLRAGFHWQGERAELFYGITRLGREFEQQPVEQTVGSIHLRIRF